jgi:hypothetical protein
MHRFGVVVGEGSRIEVGFRPQIGAGMHARPLCQSPRWQDALEVDLLVVERNHAHFPGALRDTAAGRSPTPFSINSRLFLETMRPGSWAETSITSTAFGLGLIESRAMVDRNN